MQRCHSDRATVAASRVAVGRFVTYTKNEFWHLSGGRLNVVAYLWQSKGCQSGIRSCLMSRALDVKTAGTSLADRRQRENEAGFGNKQ